MSRLRAENEACLGYVYRGDTATAAYFVEWTPTHPQRDAVFDLILGKWGEAARADDRRAVSVAFKVLNTGPSFMVQDASVRHIGSSSLVSGTLDRNSVVGTAVAPTVFEICGLIYLADPRIAVCGIDVCRVTGNTDVSRGGGISASKRPQCRPPDHYTVLEPLRKADSGSCFRRSQTIIAGKSATLQRVWSKSSTGRQSPASSHRLGHRGR